MNTPAFLLAVAALFWGAQTGNWFIAVASAALLEGPRYIARRWKLEAADFNRVSDFCTVLLVAVALYFYFSFGNPRAITLLFQWMPVILLPLVLAQAWSTTRMLDLSVLIYSLRRNPPRQAVGLNLGYPAFALWLLAASAANRQGSTFFLGVALLVAWPLLLARPRSYTMPVAAGMLLAGTLAGYGAQLGLHRTQQWLEAAAPEWLAGGGARTNPYRSTTDIGTIGDLKLSQRIVLRVEAGPEFATPILLHRASYDDYFGGTWIARNARFEQLAPSGDVSTWKLEEAREPRLRLTVHDDSDGNPVLALPANTVRIEGLRASEMKVNPLGAVQVEHKPGFFSYRAFIGEGVAVYGAPTPRDLHVPKNEAAALAQVAGELGLAEQAPRQVLAKVQQFFAGSFSYSTWLRKPELGRTPLSEFLLKTHAGHCEYFASATVLLLRAAGIPARYATGFSVQEWSALNDAYLVRERHAHAWARAWVDGAWRDVDTTPPTWSRTEAERAPYWSALGDIWSWARYRLAAWSEQAGERGWAQALLWLALPLLAWLVWRTLRGRRAKPAGDGTAGAGVRWPGQDSEFYLVERRMAELGHGRHETESLSEWLAHLAALPQFDMNSLHRLALLHYRYRFDPAGLSAAERKALREQALSWLARHATSAP